MFGGTELEDGVK